MEKEEGGAEKEMKAESAKKDGKGKGEDEKERMVGRRR